jgi:hypothetical protein
MDKVLLQRIETRRQLLARQRIARRSFSEALAAGDWAGAHRLADDLRVAAAAEAESQATMRIDVLKLLKADQRQLLAKDFEHILGSPWLPGYGRRRPIAARAREVGKDPARVE